MFVDVRDQRSAFVVARAPSKHPAVSPVGISAPWERTAIHMHAIAVVLCGVVRRERQNPVLVVKVNSIIR